MQNDVRDFLTSRRARLTPARAGLSIYGSHRRVTGLRREEVALLAGISVDYYNRIERGNLRGVSDSVLVALARALQLDQDEQAHLHDLARAAHTAPPQPGHPASGLVRPGVLRLLDTMTQAAAAVFNPRMDILATNQLGRALFTDSFSGPEQPNLARFAFLDPRAREFYPDWDEAADDAVAILRSATGSTPEDRDLLNLIDELASRSDDFAPKWAAHNVRFHRTGTKTLYHRVVGELTLSFEALDLSQDPGLTVMAYTADAGSASDDALGMLAAWHHEAV